MSEPVQQFAETVARCRAVDLSFGFRCELAPGHKELHRAEGTSSWGDGVSRQAGIRTIYGREMRGGLEDGHTHISWSSTPVLKRKGTWADCPACVEWAKELLLIDGEANG